MLEARITKTIVEPKNGDTYLLGVAEYYSDMVNFRVKFGPEEVFNSERFFQDLREALAEEFDIPSYRVDFNRHEILDKMRFWTHAFESLGIQ